MREHLQTMDLRTDRWSFDAAIEVLITALLIFTPLAFGTTQAWNQEIMLAMIAAATLCFALKFLLHPSTPISWTWAYVPIGLFLLFCVFQIVHLPADMLGKISPATVNLKNNLLGNLSQAPSVLRDPTITFYPAASKSQLRLVLGIAAIFVIVINVYRDQARIRRLLLTIACVGLAVAMLALYQNISGTDLVYGIVPAIHRNAGPFMNYSHFSQFMNLSVGAALGLLLLLLNEVSDRHRSVAGFIEEIREPQSWLIWLLVLFCVAGPITVFLSMSRMGMLSLMAAGAFSGLMLTWRSRKGVKASGVLALGIVIFACLLYAGFDAVYDRLATVRHVQEAQGGRVQMLHDMLAEFRLFPVVGTGLGTHEFIFPMFDHSTIASIATHAENEYAQLMEECGLVGVLSAAAFLSFIIFNYLRTVLRLAEPIQYVGFGLGFGLLAILIHSASDFGQHVPANALLTAISAALLFNLARQSWREPETSTAQASHSFLRISGAVVAFTFLACLFSWTLLFADRARRAEKFWSQSSEVANRLEQADWQGDNSEFIELLAPAAAAAELAPDDVTYQYGLNVGRWHSLIRRSDPKSDTLSFTPATISFASRIADQLESARLLCPTFGPALCVAGQINLFVLHRASGAEEIRTAYGLTPYDRTVCSLTAKLAIEDQQWDRSLDIFRRYIALGGSAREVIDIYLAAKNPQLAYEIAQGDRVNLQYLSTVLRADPSQAELADRCGNEALNLLLAEAQSPDASADVLADLANSYRQQGNNNAAIVQYRKALDLDYGQVDWRLQLAHTLADVGRYGEAAREMRVCLRIRPALSGGPALLAEFTGRSTAGSSSSE